MEYPKRSKLAVFIRSNDDVPREDANLGSLHLLSAIKAKVERRPRGAMFVEADFCGKTLKALVNTGATHVFMAEDIAKKIGLSITKKVGFIKAVNSKELPIFSVAKATELRIG